VGRLPAGKGPHHRKQPAHIRSFEGIKNLGLIRKSYGALNPGGLIAIQKHLLEADRTRPVSGSLFSVNMLVNTHGGRSYSAQEIKKWLSLTGFKKVKSQAKGDSNLVFGRKTS
jgi:hypothetical protein